MTTDNNRGLLNAAPIVPLGIIPDSEGAKPAGADQLELRVCGGLLLLLLMFMFALLAMLGVVLAMLLMPELLPSWADLSVVCPLAISLVGALTVLSRRSYLRYVRVRQV